MCDTIKLVEVLYTILLINVIKLKYCSFSCAYPIRLHSIVGTNTFALISAAAAVVASVVVADFFCFLFNNVLCVGTASVLRLRLRLR